MARNRIRAATATPAAATQSGVSGILQSSQTTAARCPAALHAASHARPGELRAASHAAPGDLHAALDAAPSLPSGPQHLTPLAAWLALRCPTLLVLQGKPLLRLLVPEGKPLYDVRSFPTTCFTPFDLH